MLKVLRCVYRKMGQNEVMAMKKWQKLFTALVLFIVLTIVAYTRGVAEKRNEEPRYRLKDNSLHNYINQVLGDEV